MTMERSFAAVAVAAGADDVHVAAAGDDQKDYSFGTEEYGG